MLSARDRPPSASPGAHGFLGARPAEAFATGLGLSATLGLLMIVPLLLGGYVDADHLSLARASVLITVEVAAGILALLGAVFLGGRVTLVHLARFGALLAAAAYFASAPRLGFWPLVLCRIVSGMGVGLLGAAVNASVARSQAPERLYATAVFFYGAASSVLLYLIPILTSTFGYGYMFVTVGILFIVTGLCASALHGGTVGASARAAESVRLGVQAKQWRTITLIVGYFALWIAFSMVWVFAERKAASIHMGPAQTGLALSACTIVGLLGSIAVNWLGDRFGRARPIALGGLMLAISFYAMGIAAVPFVYWVAILGYGIAYFFLLPYILGLAAQLDSVGRVAMVASMVPWVSHLVSPLLGAVVLERFGAFPTMAAVTAATAAVATAILVAAAAGVTRAPQRSTQF
jgi:Major Facilitator Superfamily